MNVPICMLLRPILSYTMPKYLLPKNSQYGIYCDEIKYNIIVLCIIFLLMAMDIDGQFYFTESKKNFGKNWLITGLKCSLIIPKYFGIIFARKRFKRYFQIILFRINFTKTN